MLYELGIVTVVGFPIHSVSKKPVEEMSRAKKDEILRQSHFGYSEDSVNHFFIASSQLHLVLHVRGLRFENIPGGSQNSSIKTSLEESLGPSENETILFSQELGHVLCQVERL